MRSLLAISLAAALLGCGSTEAPATSTEPEAVEGEAPEGEATDPSTEAALDDGDDDHAVDEEDEPEGDEPEEAAAPDMSAHEVVIVVLHDDPLLRSEERLLDVVAERMQMRRIDAIRRDATEEEASFARARFAGEAGGAMPSSLGEVGTVVFLRIPPNRELDRGQRATRGFGGAIGFRRGEAEPYVSLRIDDDAAWRGADEQLWPWLIALVRAERSS